MSETVPAAGDPEPTPTVPDEHDEPTWPDPRPDPESEPVEPWAEEGGDRDPDRRTRSRVLTIRPEAGRPSG